MIIRTLSIYLSLFDCFHTPRYFDESDCTSAHVLISSLFYLWSLHFLPNHSWFTKSPSRSLLRSRMETKKLLSFSRPLIILVGLSVRFCLVKFGCSPSKHHSKSTYNNILSIDWFDSTISLLRIKSEKKRCFVFDIFVSFLHVRGYSHLKYDRVDVIVVKEKPRHQLYILNIFSDNNNNNINNYFL